MDISNEVLLTWFTGTTVANSTGAKYSFPTSYSTTVRLITGYVVPSSTTAAIGPFPHSLTLTSAYFICRDSGWYARPFHAFTIGFSNKLIYQWGKYNPYNASGTVSFPVTFTTVYGIVAQVSGDYTGAIDCDRYPYNLTASGFSRDKGTKSSVTIGWYIAYGIKN